jgi:oligoendopeptidase F
VVTGRGGLQCGQRGDLLTCEGHTLISARGTATVSRMPETALELDSPPRWDLTSLYPDVQTALEELKVVLGDAAAFRDRYHGRVGSLEAAELASVLAELSALDNRLSRLGSFSGLALSTNINGEAERDADAAIEQGLVEAQNALRFFELEWLQVDDDRAARLAASEQLAAHRYFLLSARRFRPHVRSDDEERMLAEREPVAQGAWHTLFDQVTSTLQIPFDGRDQTISELLALVRSEHRSTRIGAYDALWSALEPHAGVQAQVYDSVVADRLAMDRVRSYDGPRRARDLANELAPSVVDGMLDAVERNYPLAHRWWALKKQLLGVDPMVLADQYAPLGRGRPLHYREAVETVLTSFGEFSPRIERMAHDLFADRRLDAEPRTGKRGGAFCASVAQDARPFILMNFMGKLDDVRTLAHELGHGMQFELTGERQSALSHHPPLALAEVASTFAEHIVFERQLEQERDPEVRLSLLADRVEGSFATIFRQTHMVRYEEKAYALRAEGKALLPERLSEFWMDTNRPYYGDTVQLPEGYRYGWAYIPHFIHTRFYTYAYVFAALASFALAAQQRKDPERFAAAYVDFLGIGGSQSPADQLNALGVDVTAPDAWDAGFGELERVLEQAEQATRTSG